MDTLQQRIAKLEKIVQETERLFALQRMWWATNNTSDLMKVKIQSGKIEQLIKETKPPKQSLRKEE